MQNNNFAETLASVASEFGVEHTEKQSRGIKPSKRPYFRWTDEQLEPLSTLRKEGKSAAEIADTLGVSRDKVISKLAAMAARERANIDQKPVQEPVEQTEPEQTTKAEPEQETEQAAPEPHEPVEQEPELNPVSQDLNPTAVDLDRMTFMAFDSVVGAVDDFNKMAACWRKALSVIEQEIGRLSYIVERHPNAEVPVCQIAATIAYDEVRA